ncbi:MAG: YfcE family phosphodiesterase [Clostridia bacterium]|nr:YfcE family phosphodiesterase [Clostridia bacterium]
MMNFLIVSDTHGNTHLLRSLLDANRAVDAILFLGDGLNEAEELCALGGYPPLIGVRGNCDSEFSPHFRKRQEEEILCFSGRRILLLHGHTASVKFSLAGLLSRARAYAVDIVLFGHTHDPEERYIPKEEGGPLWLFNPGSLGRPYDGRPHYGRLTLSDNGDVLLSHGVWEVTA